MAEVPRAPLPVVGLVGPHVVTTAETVAEASIFGPLLVSLAALWPASTGTATLPAWHAAELAFAAKLQGVVEASRQVQIQLGVGNRPPVGPTPPRRRRPECEPVPVSPHAGGDTIHNTCADVIPPNRFPEHDVLVDGVQFDALQVGADVLWEVKTKRNDTYHPFIKGQTIEDDVARMMKEQEAASRCGYGFIVSVSSAAHRDALLKRVPELTIRLNECLDER